ncbi:tripartite tricarboxylate transporter TctB family protein [Magnetospirillum sp. UT-4]|uniref:tripartite tricarboxylate transporter TctB family protein n=1 Tax=Magnetospirillum sp. UT-4 TaxID=2681467 RepID=UPI0013804C29|nr:tripartite tricarboxylate transporter TctB family protein [Magnetospirillum sp. UT-4]CAA7614343.1 conserved membrane hypothetical protein [Magnetospirillum sp. UT-4]
MTRATALLLRAAPPALIVVAALVLPGYLLPNPEAAALVGEGEAGPTLWPTMLLWLVGLCAAFWLVRVVWAGLRAPPPEAAPAAAGRPVYNRRLAWAGVAMTFAYGYAIEMMGFAVATLLFLAAWCVLGGIRRAVVLVPVAAIGTVVLLYVFVALAQMPLDRGRGVFTAATTGLYQAIGIY